MYCLDSDILIAFLKGDKDAIRFISQHNDVCTTVINAQEILFGVSHERFDVICKFFENMDVIAYDALSLSDVVIIKKDLSSQGQTIGSFDEIIAGICVAHKLILVSRNNKHFSRVSQLKTISW